MYMSHGSQGGSIPCIGQVGTRVGVPGWVYWVGTRVGYTGCTTQPPRFARGEVPTAEGGPRKPCRGWSGWSGARTDRRLYGPWYHPSGPVGPLQGPPCTRVLGNAASWPIGRDLTSFLVKLVEMTKCRQKSCKRPVIVPIFQNGSEKSPLEILRFPIYVAFSHKELMVPF